MNYSRISVSDWRRISWLENLDAADPWTRLAIKQVKEAYDESVSCDTIAKSYIKFGQNESAGGSSAVTVMTLGSGQIQEDYVSANSITHFASSSTSEGSMVVEGHTISGTDFTPVTQTVTLAGQTKTALTTPLARVHRIYNDSTAVWLSNVYVARNVTFTNGIPQDSSAIHIVGIASEGQSLKAAMTSASTEFFFITDVYADVNAGFTTTQVDMRVRMRLAGKTFRTQHEMTINSDSQPHIKFEFKPYLIIPNNSDIELTANSTSVGVSVSGGFSAIFAETR